ncbi:MAG: hypothetical protein AAB316_16480 [Bacteroidota bacterium]
MITRLKHFALAMVAGLVLFSFYPASPSHAEEPQQEYIPHSGQSVFDVLNQEEMMEITLVAELDSLIQVRNSDKFRPATFSYENKDGVRHTWQIKVRPRGKFRRQICDFPPLKLKFSKDELEAAGLEGFNDMKLVTHCMDEREVGSELVLREYLAYKLYNVLTPNSFRVQLVKVTYRDSKDKGRKITRLGFLLEDEKQLAQRIGGEQVDTMGLAAERYIPSQEKIASMFQFMIGNTDWDYRMLRNVTFFRTSGGKLAPVPYDFDFSNLVGASYRRPNADLKQTGAMERIYMGQSKSARELYSTFSYFRTKKEALLDVVRNFRFLDSDSRDGLDLYLEEFFDLIQDEETAQRGLFERNSAERLSR